MTSPLSSVPPQSLDEAFREAMSRFASGVTVVTTRDAAGRPHGFTASSFCSVSADPPLVLVCLARTARSYPVFSACDRFAVSVLRPSQVALARRFASRGVDKFAGDDFVRTPDGPLAVRGALAVVEAVMHDRIEAGDHVLLLGRVDRVEVSEGGPAVYFRRAFHTI